MPAKPFRARSDAFSDVSCGLDHGCIAVGAYTSASGRIHPLAEAWHGAGWRILAAQEPAPARSALLSGISCTVRACIAVGQYTDGSGYIRTLAELWDGMRWQIMRTPDSTARSRPSILQEVSCPSPTACMAVGHTGANGELVNSLAELWRSGRWRLITMPSLPFINGYLSGISCTTPDMCIATGGYLGSNFLSLAWDGARWRLLPTPDAHYQQVLAGVSCTHPLSCLAVGDTVIVNAPYYLTLAAQWDGSTWRQLPAPGR